MLQLHETSLAKFKEWLSAHGEKPFRAAQIFSWVYERATSQYEKMTNLPATFREWLAEKVCITPLKLVRTVDSSDGETTKFLWELSDGAFVESVLIYAPGRRTVCVSSQVGCPARCAFCASGKEGWKRNLSAAEIMDQVYQIHAFLHAKGERVSHVVFMGMGEPFENYDTVVQAILLLSDPERLHISQRRITVSTVGVVEGIHKFAEEKLQANLVLSLHAPNQHLRKKIIPYARKYPLEEILNAMSAFAQKTKRDITYEYTLLADINDQVKHAEELAKLLSSQQCTVNLIPYNPVIGLKLRRPEKEVIESFRSVLLSAGIHTTWRYTKGKDIAAACGQLALVRSC